MTKNCWMETVFFLFKFNFNFSPTQEWLPHEWIGRIGYKIKQNPIKTVYSILCIVIYTTPNESIE